MPNEGSKSAYNGKITLSGNQKVEAPISGKDSRSLGTGVKTGSNLGRRK